MPIDDSLPFKPVRIAVLTISDSRSAADDKSGDKLEELLTAAGHVLAILKHLPTEGEKFTDRGWRFEIVDMDGRKIDKLLVTEVSKPKEAAG